MSTKLYINKENLLNNINYIKSKLSKETKIIAMVKANAYGARHEHNSKFLGEKWNIKFWSGLSI